MGQARRQLFERYPGTAALPWVCLADLPTPVQPSAGLAEAAGCGEVWLKRDDLSGGPYGGNKVRKLEFLLGEAASIGATDLITFGAAGSNHALATAVYGAAAGMRVHSMLMPQPSASYVQRNLRASYAAGADLRHFSDASAALKGAAVLRRELEASGKVVGVIPFGGTTALSSAGFVNAAFELAEQVEAGSMPEPDRLYVTLGSSGTAAGLVLGLRAAGMKTRVTAVPVIAEGPENERLLLASIIEAQDVLRSADPTFPDFTWHPSDLDVAEGFVGEGYAVPTDEGAAAISLACSASGIVVDGTYGGKTLAALLRAGGEGRLIGESVLFWHTYNSRDITGLVESVDPADLPAAFSPYLSAAAGSAS